MKNAFARIPDAELLKLDAQVCFQVYAATNLITRVYRPLLAPLGLTYPQYLVMLVLWERAPLTVRELGRKLLLESGTLSPLLKRLQQRGLIKKKADPADARRVIVTLGAKGEAMRSRAAEVPRALLCQLVDRGGTASTRSLLALRAHLKPLVSAWAAHSPEEPTS